ncbi:MAG: acetyltransferase [Candidatus Omnitrophota bacterium]|nr:acetyltransferase [Candidatus Omnitrophota bacterium]
MKKIILLGGGGHCKVVIEAILSQKKFKIAGIIDKKKNIGKKILGFSIIGEDNDVEDYFKKGVKNCFIAVGSIGNTNLRINLFNLAKNFGFKFPNVIHPGALISKFAKVGEGNYIAPGVIINAGVIIRNNCIINTATTIDHDCQIGDFVHIAPGVTISGGVKVGQSTHIGTGSSVIQSIKIGKNTIIGAGSMVTNDIDNNIIAYGNPCRKVKENV